MADISSIGQGSVGPLNRSDSPTSNHETQRRQRLDDIRRDDRRGDRVELSDHARYLARLKEADGATPARQQRIEEIRQSIADGTYDTPQRLDAAIERLLDDLEA